MAVPTQAAVVERTPDAGPAVGQVAPDGLLVQAGFEIRAHGDPQDQQEEMVHHVYDGDEHIGWAQPYSRAEKFRGRGMKLSDLPELAKTVRPGAPYTTWEKAQGKYELPG